MYKVTVGLTKKQIEALKQFTDSVLYQDKEQGDLTQAFKILDKKLDETLRYYF